MHIEGYLYLYPARVRSDLEPDSKNNMMAKLDIGVEKTNVCK